MNLTPVFLLPILTGTVFGGEFNFEDVNAGGDPVPAGAEAVLKLPEFAVIGDLVAGRFVIRNKGETAFKVSLGGDNRGAPVPMRLKVRVTNPAGRELPDLTRTYSHMGGVMWSPTVEPGRKTEIEFRLPAFAAVLEPGTYTVEAAHDLGWKVDTARPHPVATAKITFSLPDAATAAARVREVLTSEGGSNAWSASWLKHPVFLAPLTDEARKGSTAAAKGIGGIASAAATRALLELLAADKPEITETAARTLLARLPSLKDAKVPAVRSVFDLSDRAELLALWEPSMDAPLLAGARQLLRQESESLIAAGADLIAARGGAEDAPLVLESLQRTMNVYHGPRFGPGANVLDPPGAQRPLIAALDILRDRGWRVDFNGGGTAKILVQFRQFGDKSIPHNAQPDYVERSFTWVVNGPAALKENALRALPSTDGFALKPIHSALNDKDWGVVRAACEAAGRSGRPEFIPSLCQVVETIHETFVQEAAHEAAVTLHAGPPLWEAWTEVITDEAFMVPAIEHLCIGTLDMPFGGSMSGNSNSTREERFAIRKAWREFIAKNRELLSSGERVPADDPSVIPMLTGSGFAGRPGEHAVTFQLNDGKQWPKSK